MEPPCFVPPGIKHPDCPCSQGWLCRSDLYNSALIEGVCALRGGRLGSGHSAGIEAWGCAGQGAGFHRKERNS